MKSSTHLLMFTVYLKLISLPKLHLCLIKHKNSIQYKYSDIFYASIFHKFSSQLSLTTRHHTCRYLLVVHSSPCSTVKATDYTDYWIGKGRFAIVHGDISRRYDVKSLNYSLHYRELHNG